MGAETAPPPAEPGWKRTSPVAVIFFLFGSARRVFTDGLPILAPIAAAAASSRISWSWLTLAGALLALLALAWAVLSWLRFRFRVGAGRLEVRRGVLAREALSIDFDRVQNVSIGEPPYMRPLGLVKFSVDTAGSHGKEVALGGIDRKLALELRSEMLSCAARAEPLPAAGADDAGPAGGETLLLRRSTGDLVIYGLTALSLFWVAVLLGFLFSAGDDLPVDWTGWIEGLFATVAAGTEGLGALRPLLLAALALGLVALLPLLSVLGAIVRHHGYRLSFDGETFRRTAGLLARHDASVRGQKIQAVLWKQNLLSRWLRRVNVKLQVTRAGQAETSGIDLGGLSFVVPAVAQAQARELTTRFLPGARSTAPEFSGIDRRHHLLRGLFLGWLPPLLAASLPPATLVHPGFALLLPLGLALGTLVQVQVGRRLGYAVDGEHGYLRQGFLGSQVTVFPLRKVQRVDLRQTPAQRRARLAHLTVHLASGSTTLPYMRLDHARLLRDLALFHAESDPRPWF